MWWHFLGISVISDGDGDGRRCSHDVGGGGDGCCRWGSEIVFCGRCTIVVFLLVLPVLYLVYT